MTNENFNHRVHKEWQWSLSGVYSIMKEKSAQPGTGARLPPFTISTIPYKVVVYAPADSYIVPTDSIIQ